MRIAICFWHNMHRLADLSCAVALGVIMFSAGAYADARTARCKALAPTPTQNIRESFKGEIEGKLEGIVSNFIGGVAGLKGEYTKIVEDSLKGRPENEKIYFWQRLIYFACINPESGVDINDLAKAYLTGPPIIGSRAEVEKNKIDIDLVGFDRPSHEAVGHYQIPGFSGARFPNLVFRIANSSDREISISLDECVLINFRFPEPVRARVFDAYQGDTTRLIDALTGTTLMMPVGPSVVEVGGGRQKYIAYGIGSVEAPSYESRRKGSSVCKFRVGDDLSFEPKPVSVSSPKRYLSQD
jgi:hypothetical protein